MTPPLLSIVGKKNSGKTTLVVRLSEVLTRRGVRVMTIKHGTHTFDLDPANTDTYRHYHEGLAERVAMISPDKFAFVERLQTPLTLEDVASRYLTDADLILCEGFKTSDLPKIEIFRRAAHDAPLYDATLSNAASWEGMVSDGPVDSLPFPLFRLDDSTWLDTLATWVQGRFVTHRS